MAMTVREQLTEQASRPRPVKERDSCHFPPGKRMVLTLPPDREISLTAWVRDPEPFRKLIRVGAVNTAEVCGIPAHRLFITGFRIDSPDVAAHLIATSDHAVRVDLIYCPSPMRGGPEVNFDALLDALEAGAVAPDVPPERPETWHDLPPML